MRVIPLFMMLLQTAEQEQKELDAAHRLFGMLPEEQGQSLLQLWLEFESAQSADAKFAKALDRIIPMLLNYHNQGQNWQEHGVTRHQALTINQKIELARRHCGTKRNKLSTTPQIKVG